MENSNQIFSFITGGAADILVPESTCILACSSSRKEEADPYLSEAGHQVAISGLVPTIG